MKTPPGNGPVATTTAGGFRPCIVIPFYNHAASISGVVQQLQSLALYCYLVNDASDASCQAVLDALSREHAQRLEVISYHPNQGKGAAVLIGLAAAARAGYTHVAQIDADGQHQVADLAILLQQAGAHPDAAIIGYAVYDDSVPASRHYGRYLTHVWVWINTLSLSIRDSMCGLRVYPLAVTLDICRRSDRTVFSRMGRRMSFDIEILVRLCWRGVQIINMPVTVRYPTDGVSHFRLLRDNVAISCAHARLFLGMLARAPALLLRHAHRGSA